VTTESGGCALNERLYFGSFLLGGEPEIALHLETEPEIRIGVKCLGEPQGHVRRDSGFAVEDAGQGRSCNAQMASDFCDGSAL